MAQWQTQPEASQSELIYLHDRPFSAQYYSLGKAQERLVSLDELMIERPQAMFVAIEKRYIPTGYNWAQQQCQQRGESKRRLLLFCPANS